MREALGGAVDRLPAGLGLLLFTALGLAGAIDGGRYLAAGDPKPAVMYGLGGLALLLLVGVGCWRMAVPSRVCWVRVEAGAAGTTVRHHRVFEWGIRLMAAAWAISALLAGALAAQGRSDLPLMPDTATPVELVLLIAIGLAAVWVTFGDAGAGYLRLTPVGFACCGFIARPRRVEWAEVVGIDAEPWGPLVCRLADGSSRRIAEADPDRSGAVMYRLIEHYWANPGDRAEFTDGRVSGRIALLRGGD